MTVKQIQNKKIENDILRLINTKTSTEVCKLLHINKNKYVNTLVKYSVKNLNRIRKYSLNERFFEDIDTEEKAYILGFIYADGCIWKNSIKFGIAKQDPDILKKIANNLYKTEKYNLRIDKHNVWRLNISCKMMVDDLRKIGLCENKTAKIRIPFEKLSTKIIWHFIRGYFDGDGSVYYCQTKTKNKNWGANMVCKNKKFLEDICLLLENKNIYYRFELATKNDIWKLSIRRKQDLYNFLNLLYANSSIFLDRKFKKYKDFLNDKFYNN